MGASQRHSQLREGPGHRLQSCGSLPGLIYLHCAPDLQWLQCQAIDGSRLRLGLPSLDLIQFFWQDYRNKNYVIVAEHLAELQASCAKHAAPLLLSCAFAAAAGPLWLAG